MGKRLQKVVDAAKRVRETGKPEWVDFQDARLLLGPITDLNGPVLFVNRGRLRAAVTVRKDGWQTYGPVPGTSCRRGIYLREKKVLAEILECHKKIRNQKP